MQTPPNQPLSPTEYQQQRRRHAVTLYFGSVEEMRRFQDLAAKTGYARNFNGWVIQQLFHATSGNLYPPGYVDGLKADVERLGKWHETAREEAEDLREQLRALQAEHKTALILMAGLPTGPDALKRLMDANQARGASA